MCSLAFGPNFPRAAAARSGPGLITARASDTRTQVGADIAIGPLTRDPGTRLAFVRGPEGIMVELVQIR